MFDIDSSSQTAHVSRGIIAEDDRTHRRLSRSTLAHKKNFLFLVFLSRLHYHDFSEFSDLAAMGVAKKTGAVKVVLRCRTTGERIEAQVVANGWLWKTIQSECWMIMW